MMKRPHIQTGPIMRTRAMERHRIKHTKAKTVECDFCHFSHSDDQTVKEYKYFWLVKNIFPYAVWDACRVTDQELLSPKRHVTSISQFTPEEGKEYLEIISKAEGNGYAVYSRPDGSAGKSVAHQHTHFISIDNKRIKTLYYNFAPHILWFK